MYAEVITSIETRKLNRTFSYRVPASLSQLIAPGQGVLVPFGRGNKRIRAIVVGLSDFVAEGLDDKLKDIIEIVSDHTEIDVKMLRLAAKVRERYFLSMASVLRLMILEKGRYREQYLDKQLVLAPSGREIHDSLRKSKTKELLALLIQQDGLPFEEVMNLGYSKAVLLKALSLGYLSLVQRTGVGAKTTLNPQQEEAHRIISKAITDEHPQRFLLFGVTGSGKTEVYFRSIEDCLARGKQAIILLPEINLTEQMLNRYENAFPGNVVQWHSQIGHGEKRKAWNLLNNKEKNILIGPRSAIFTNMADLGLIIVDEEHDNSYYQQNMPSYNGRDVALMRGEVEGAVVILGSATPSTDSMMRAQTGEYVLLSLEEKYFGQSHPEVRLVDMGQELKEGNHSILSREMEKNIRETLNRHEKVLLFLNRRGYYNFLLCRDCGHVSKCPDCDIPLTYHEKAGKLICHYCGHTSVKPQSCPECGGQRIRGIGIGTEQVVDLVQKTFPGHLVGRLDADVVGGKNARQHILEEFKHRDTEILIGTQMIAKGIDFPNVGLVGILLGDMSLNFPDYRSREWTFQLLMQVIGRTGRREKKGLVLLQTYRPFDIIYKDIVSFDFTSFYRKELQYRKRYDYPPYGEILLLGFFGTSRDDVQKTIWDFHEGLTSTFKKEEVFRPKAARPEKRGDQYRWNLILKLKADSLDEGERHLRRMVLAFYEDPKQKINLSIERNPSGLL